ncbi:MAG: D-aminoacyl-tRNA deacylase [Acidobacteriota bacterium]
MRAVIQRVKSACVEVDEQIVGKIAQGLLVLLGVARDDTQADADYLLDKTLNLRIFNDEEGKMNRSVLDAGGALLVVSQFTLYGDARKGRRPSYIEAAEPERANALYEYIISEARKKGLAVETGVFQAMMQVNLINDGPVTILLDSRKNF